MKKLLYIVPLLLGMSLTSCYDEDIENINNRLDAIENTQIATISQQITSINNSILLLNGTDKELKDYITALETEAESLQTQLTATNAKIDEIEQEIWAAISSEKADVLAELEAFKATVNGELEAINSVLETLKAKDAELEEQIVGLKEYVDSELTATEDWATATFATLEQYNTVVSTIATIEGTIEGLNESIAALETRINEKIAKDIETACATLSADLQKAIEEVTEQYTAAIATATEEITAAYTAKLESAISALETSMKEWVNEQLTAYSTIVDTEAKITALQSEMDGKLAAQKTYLEALVNALSSSVTTDITAIKKQIEEVNEAIAKNAEEIENLRGELAEQKKELTEAYTTAIATAIAKSEGKMNDKLAEEIAAINERIDKSDIAAIEALIAHCKQRMETLEADVAQLKSDVLQLQMDVEELQEITEKLLAQIQSITYIPTYDDGKATIDYHSKRGTLDFQISPKSAVVELEKVWQSALSFKAVHTQTRAVDFINLPITSFEADATNGTITIEVDGTNLGENFFVEKLAASATVEVSDGNNYIHSPYLNLTPNFIIHFEDKEVERLCVLNWDTDGDCRLSYDEAAAVTDIGTIFSNYYWDDEKSKYIVLNRGINTFTEFKYFVGLTAIPACAFEDDHYDEETNHLMKICLPSTIKTIGNGAFSGCDDLAKIDIPQGVTTIEAGAFDYCSSLTKITLPASITAIEAYVFGYCPNLVEVYCKSTIVPDAIHSGNAYTSFWWHAFDYNAPNRKIYVPAESVEAYKAADGWKEYADDIVGYDFEQEGD